ncbi:hypothetical protein FRUB_04587 [Fimbriiglobus ruber]|uniref:Uncharacterized protein n=1 Tax=Fimbriiglobus ruber TaxID=1908690 RepID=A0A225DNE7_9BACT|nr:hypothetical protein [Fimbriiglobus ruber]OWK41224.1 hypothetical protein FRUB_04587 [Fimbriiglobus ruber]
MGDPHAGRVGDPGDHPGGRLRLLARVVPQAVLGDLQVFGPHLVGPGQVRERLDHPDGLELPPVARLDALLREFLEDGFEGVFRVVRPRQGEGPEARLPDLGRGDRGRQPGGVVAGPQELLAAGLGPDRGDRFPEQEPVGDGREFLPVVGRCPLVARGQAQLQGHRTGDPVAGVVHPLVQHPEQGVQDRRRRLEHLVQVRELGLRQFARRNPQVLVLLQGGQADRPEALLRGREFRQQDRELGPARPGQHGIEEQALGRPRRPDQQHMFVGDQGGEDEVDLVLPLDQGGR